MTWPVVAVIIAAIIGVAAPLTARYMNGEVPVRNRRSSDLDPRLKALEAVVDRMDKDFREFKKTFLDAVGRLHERLDDFIGSR